MASKIVSAETAAVEVPDGAVVSVSSSSGLGCPDKVLAATGARFDMHRDVAARRPGVLTQVGLDTFADPIREGCAMNASAAARPIVARVEFGGETWLHFPNIVPNVAIIRATTADERGNLTYEHEGAYLGGLDQAIAVRNHGGL